MEGGRAAGDGRANPALSPAPPAAPSRPLPARHREGWGQINNIFVTLLGRPAGTSSSWVQRGGPGGTGRVSTVGPGARPSEATAKAHRGPLFSKSLGTTYRRARHGAHVTLVPLSHPHLPGRQPHTSIPQAGNEARSSWHCPVRAGPPSSAPFLLLSSLSFSPLLHSFPPFLCFFSISTY